MSTARPAPATAHKGGVKEEGEELDKGVVDAGGAAEAIGAVNQVANGEGRTPDGRISHRTPTTPAADQPAGGTVGPDRRAEEEVEGERSREGVRREGEDDGLILLTIPRCDGDTVPEAEGTPRDRALEEAGSTNTRRGRSVVWQQQARRRIGRQHHAVLRHEPLAQKRRHRATRATTKARKSHEDGQHHGHPELHQQQDSHVLRGDHP